MKDSSKMFEIYTSGWNEKVEIGKNFSKPIPF